MTQIEGCNIVVQYIQEGADANNIKISMTENGYHMRMLLQKELMGY